MFQGLFDFNAYSALLLPAFLQGGLVAVLSFIRYKKESASYHLFLGILLVLLTIRLSFWMLGFAGWYDHHDKLTTWMFYFPFNTLLFIGPCLYFYFLSITNRDFHLTKVQWPHFILPLLMLILYAIKFGVDFIFYRPFPVSERFQYGTRGPLAELDKAMIIYIASYMSLGFYFTTILKALKRYEQYLITNFAETEGIDLRWLKRLILFTVCACALFFVFYIFDFFTRLNYILNWYPYLLLGVLIYYVSINGYFNSGSLFRLLHFSHKGATETTKAMVMNDIEIWQQNLSKLMELEQPHLDPAITLSLLATKLGTNSTVLSKIINDGFGQNFNDYINELRVKAVVKQLDQRNYEKYSLMGIAWDCGFNSKTTFNRSFKKVTGITPTEYIKEVTELKNEADHK